MKRRLLLGAAAIGCVGGLTWVLASIEPGPYVKFVSVRIQTDEDVCWEVFNGRVNSDGIPETQFGCGSRSAGYDNDLVAVPSSVVIRKTQGDGKLRAWFAVNGEITDSGTIDEPGEKVYLSGD